MFGLEDQKKKKAEEFVYEIEKELKDRSYFNKIKDRIDSRVKLIKDALRSGDSKEEFDRYGTLLHGYTSFQKVMTRLKGK